MTDSPLSLCFGSLCIFVSFLLSHSQLHIEVGEGSVHTCLCVRGRDFTTLLCCTPLKLMKDQSSTGFASVLICVIEEIIFSPKQSV